MKQYRVIGPLDIDGKSKGELVGLDDEGDINVQALIDAGHIEPAGSRTKSPDTKDSA